MANFKPKFNKDPLHTPIGAANAGAAGMLRGTTPLGHPTLFELAEVVTYDSVTHTATVALRSGLKLYEVPQIKATANSYDHLTMGTSVVIFWGLGFAAIMGCIDFTGPQQSAIPACTLTGVEGVGSSDPSQPTASLSNYKPPGAPTDMGPGDWAQVGSLGNHVAVLEGGVSLLGSPSAHVQSMGTTGTLKTVARNIQSISDFGTFKTVNDQGKTSFILRAGSNQTTQTGADEKHWTIRLDLGATGDLFDFSILQPEGKLLFRFHVGSDGRVQIYGDGGVDISSGSNGTAETRHDINGDHTAVVQGDKTSEVNGKHLMTVAGESKTTVLGDLIASTASDLIRFIGNNATTAIVGDDVSSVGGSAIKKISKEFELSAKEAASISSEKVTTLEGPSIKLGDNASQPVIRGLDFESQVMSNIGLAGSTATFGSTVAQAILFPDTLVAPSFTTKALAEVLVVLTSIGSLLTQAAAGFNSTLSAKTKTE